jgi:hypothetical protein
VFGESRIIWQRGKIVIEGGGDILTKTRQIR